MLEGAGMSPAPQRYTLPEALQHVLKQRRILGSEDTHHPEMPARCMLPGHALAGSRRAPDRRPWGMCGSGTCRTGGRLLSAHDEAGLEVGLSSFVQMALMASGSSASSRLGLGSQSDGSAGGSPPSAECCHCSWARPHQVTPTGLPFLPGCPGPRALLTSALTSSARVGSRRRGGRASGECQSGILCSTAELVPSFDEKRSHIAAGGLAGRCNLSSSRTIAARAAVSSSRTMHAPSELAVLTRFHHEATKQVRVLISRVDRPHRCAPSQR